MSLLDILTGRKPLFKSDEFKQRIVDVEQGYARLINSNVQHNEARKPPANPAYLAAAIAEDNKSTPRAAQRYTLDTITPIKVCDTQGERRRIYVTVIKVGTTAYFSHEPIRLRNVQAGIREGVPVTNAGAGQPGLEQMPWQGAMYAIGSTTGMLIDIEME